MLRFIGFILAVELSLLATINCQPNPPLDPPFDPQLIHLPKYFEMSGALAPNTLLENFTRVATNQVYGPETIEIFNGTIYTGLSNGQVVTVDANGNVNKVVTIGNETDDRKCSPHQPSSASCGRPLGLRLKPNTSLLYVADAFNGIYKIDLANGNAKTLVLSANDSRFGAKPMKLVNDLDINGDMIYFVDTSYVRDINSFLFEHMESAPRGRLFAYNERTNQLNLIADKLYFPNGIQLTPDKAHILVNENTMARIIKVQLSGKKKGHSTVFANLPGMSDTIRMTQNNTLLVPFAMVRSTPQATFLDVFGKYPLVRKSLYQSVNLEQLFFLLPTYGLVAEYNLNGEPIRSWHDPTGTNIQSNSNAMFVNNKLVLGTILATYLAEE